MFKVGDKVVINESAGHAYTCSRPGSVGVIVQVEEYDVMIKFSKLTGDYHSPDNLEPIWTIATNHVSPLKIYTPQEKVCRKIKQMEERRKNVSVYI